MAWSWSGVATLAGNLLPFVGLIGGPVANITLAISRAILDVEAAVRDTGAKKKQRAVEIVGSLVEAAEGITGRDMLGDALVAEATAACIDAEVALRNAHAHLAEVVVDYKLRRDAAEAAEVEAGTG